MPRFSQPSYRKNDVDLIELYGQKLKAKLVDILVEETVKDRKFAFAMFANEIFQGRSKSYDRDELTTLVKRMIDGA